MKTSVFTANSEYKRADVFLSEASGITRSHIKKLCEDGLAKIDGKPIKSSRQIKAGEAVEVSFPEPSAVDLTPADIDINIVYEDDYLAVIDKPQGLTVHAGGGTKGDTLVNALLYHLDSLSGINGELRPGIVHRIDKDTSGLLVVAKNDKAHVSLAKQIEKKTCKREYLALLEGVVADDRGHIETLITRSDRDRKAMTVSTVKGRRATTDYFVEKRYKNFTLCRFSLGTGRTHQIRVHAKYIGHPVVGDRTYGYKKQRFELDGQLLHAYKLSFDHPSTGERMTFTSPLPAHFKRITDILDKRE